MSRASKHVARFVRVLVACFALGLLAPPVAAAATSPADVAIASLVSARATTHRAPARASVVRTHGHVAEPSLDAARAIARSSYPPRARTAVVRHRLFLRHAALLC